MAKLITVTWRDWSDLTAAIVMLPLVKMGIHFLGFNYVCACLERLAPKNIHKRPALPETRILQLTRLVDAAAGKWPVKVSCLSRSLTLWYILRRYNVATKLLIGIKKTEDRIQAHAWLELNGNVLNDSSENVGQFTAFDKIITPSKLAVK